MRPKYLVQHRDLVRTSSRISKDGVIGSSHDVEKNSQTVSGVHGAESTSPAHSRNQHKEQSTMEVEDDSFVHAVGSPFHSFRLTTEAKGVTWRKQRRPGRYIHMNPVIRNPATL